MDANNLRQVNISSPRILLGGIGGDSHSVGLSILRQALEMNNFQVLYLGIQNRLEDFFEFASIVNAILVSNLDGHARHYLRVFPKLIRERPAPGVRWYLGGNLTIGDVVGEERHFREMGFDRVFVKFVDVETVLETLKRDLHGVEPAGDPLGLWPERKPGAADQTPSFTEETLEPDVFEKERKLVLDHWKTGPAARDMRNNAEFLLRQPNFCLAQRRVNEGQTRMLVQPRSGVAGVQDQIKLFRAFREAGAGVLSFQVDSLTRNNDYAGVEEMVRESPLYGGDALNGFPVVNHGVPALRRIITEVGVPLQTRHSTRDPRLLAEISLAGGVTAYEGGAICYNIPYYKNYPLSEAIPNWQYVDRLVGMYHEQYGITIDREFFGTLTATLIPPCLAIVINLIESILAVQQGVKCLSVGYAEQGHRVQDIAAIEAVTEIVSSTLNNMGYHSVQVNGIFHQYMAAFPTLPTMAEELIRRSATSARLARATRILTKTPVEAVKIPTLKDNLHGINLVLRGINDADELKVDRRAVDAEKALIKNEVDAVMNEVFRLGKGELAPGVIRAFARGVIDVPFSPSVYNHNAVVTARDVDGAVRFLNCGNLPFDGHIKAFHAEKMSARRRMENLADTRHDYRLVEKDVLRIARGQFEHWPLCD